MGHVKISPMGNGTYHFVVERAVRGILREYERQVAVIEDVKLVFNIGGLPISNCAMGTLWLILCLEMSGDLQYPVGIFYGKNKPVDSNDFHEGIHRRKNFQYHVNLLSVMHDQNLLPST